jgi:hypothetical protein
MLINMMISTITTIFPLTFNSLCSTSDIAYELMLDMEKNGPEPNIYTYNTVTRAFAESGRLQVR